MRLLSSIDTKVEEFHVTLVLTIYNYYGKEKESSKERKEEGKALKTSIVSPFFSKHYPGNGVLFFVLKCHTLPKMISIFEGLLSGNHTRSADAFKPLIEKVLKHEASVEKFSVSDFSKKTEEFKKRLTDGENIETILPEAFALVREVARRTLKERHYDVQILGGAVLHQGAIAEMRTGEGKTLVGTLPAYLNALTGKGVHVVTVNDYLSRRDAVWMGQIYALLGISVGVLNHETSYIYDPGHQEVDEKRDELGSFKIFYEFLRPVSRREAYQADITYGTNNEFGFDYLRDHLVHDPKELVQRGHHYAIVDEIDSILIDEARTPLIISGHSEESGDLYRRFASIAGQLNENEDFTVDEKQRAATLTDNGISKAEKLLGVQNLYTEQGIKFVHHLEIAVRAKAIFKKDRDYVVQNGAIVIVDEFTGRLQPGRRWSEGLHQAVEAKEGVAIERESRTYASVSYQNYFRLYEKLSGMTGTATTSAEEFFKVYKLDVVVIPTNKVTRREDKNDLVFQVERGKFKALAQKVSELQKKGQPVLIGTASIEKNEIVSEYFKQAGISHKVLNAKNHENEGEIIAQAGVKSSVVVATNLAGRGVDIKLGGNPHSAEAYEEVKNLGGLFVIGTERHEARRIDNQLRGRSGRQGDPGETQFFVSLEDNLMRIFASDMIKNMMGRFGIPEDQPIENKLITKSLESAQEKIEGFNFDRRKQLLEYDNVMNHQRQIVYARREKILQNDKAYLAELLEELRQDERVREVIEEKEKLVGADVFADVFRRAALQVNDMLWIEHLEAMDYLRDSVGLRSVGQRDPIIEYKRDGLGLFKEMEGRFYEVLGNALPSISFKPSEGKEKKEPEPEYQEVHMGDPDQGQVTGRGSLGEPKVGRNYPCPCGSGKKYKKCHGK